jgi:hypothetical protein
MAVYFAQVGRYIKVGYSASPERRVRNLFRSGTSKSAPADCPRDKASRRLLAVIPGSLDTEHACHVALDDFAVGGEFFVDEPEVRHFIAEAKRGHIEQMTRPAGPVTPDYDERDLPPAQYAQLVWALDRIFQPSSA